MKNKEINLLEIANSLNIPILVLEWSIRQNKDMEEGVHYRYCDEDKSVRISLLGFVILICGNLSRDYDKIVGLLEKFFEPKRDDSFLLTLQSLISKELDASVQLKDEVPVTGQADTKSDTPATDSSPVAMTSDSDRKKRHSEAASGSMVPDLTDAKAIEWSTWVRRELADYVRDQNNSGNKCAFASCLKQIYRIISDEHGVDFDEARVEFCKTYGLPEGTKVSIFRIISDSQAGRNLFQQTMMEFIQRR